MTTTALLCDSPAQLSARHRSGAPTAGVDEILACQLRHALRALAKHSPAYAAVFSSRAGTRLAGHIAAGLVESATAEGRQAMQKALDQVRLAATVPPGLDTNELMDRVTGRRNPRLEREGRPFPALRAV